MKDLQKPASLLLQLGLAPVYIGFSRGIQTRQTIPVECVYPLADIGKRPVDFVCDVLREQVPVFQDSDRFLPEPLIVGLPPPRENLVIGSPNESDMPPVYARL